MIRAVVVTTLGGFFVYAVFSMAIPNGVKDAFGQDESPIIFLFRYHFGSFVANLMIAIAFTAFLSALLANVAVCTRLIYSLSRDRMLPASGLLQKVNPKTRTPLYVIGLVAAIALILNLMSEGIDTRIVSIVAVCYYGTYILTMAGAIYGDRKGSIPSVPAGSGYTDLGRWLVPVAVAGIAFGVFIIAYLTIPKVNHTAGEYSLYAFLVGLLWWGAYRTADPLGRGRAAHGHGGRGDGGRAPDRRREHRGRMTLRIGVDTGGTFSDFVLFDDGDGSGVDGEGAVHTRTIRRALWRAGLEALVRQAPGRVGRIVVGTTVATNAVIQRRGPRVVYVDERRLQPTWPFIGRLDKAQSLRPELAQVRSRSCGRRDCIGVAGPDRGVDGSGDRCRWTYMELGCGAAELRALPDGDAAAVAVCLLFSYVEPRSRAAFVREGGGRGPGASSVSLSHEVSPVWREYERASTTIADAFVKPVVSGYVDARQERAQRGPARGAGNCSPRTAAIWAPTRRGGARPSCCSRALPAAWSAPALADATGQDAVFTLDMGGTSCDIGLVLDGETSNTSTNSKSPSASRSASRASPSHDRRRRRLDRLDRQGRAAACRPAERRRGARARSPTAAAATEPTVTDANLVLGRLDPEYFLGGRDGARRRGGRARAVAELGAARSDRRAEEPRSRSCDTADENMANAIRLIAVDRGLDPRELRAHRVRRRRAAARPRGRPTARHDDRPRPAASRALLRLWRRDRARPRVDRTQTCPRRPDADDVDLARGRAPSCSADARRRAARRSVDGGDAVASLARSTCATPARTTSSRCRCRRRRVNADGWDALLERFEREHESQLRVLAPGRADGDHQSAGDRVRASERPPARRTRRRRSRAPRARRATRVWFDATPRSIARSSVARPAGRAQRSPARRDRGAGFDHARLPGDDRRVGASGVMGIDARRRHG